MFPEPGLEQALPSARFSCPSVSTHRCVCRCLLTPPQCSVSNSTWVNPAQDHFCYHGKARGRKAMGMASSAALVRHQEPGSLPLAPLRASLLSGWKATWVSAQKRQSPFFPVALLGQETILRGAHHTYRSELGLGSLSYPTLASTQGTSRGCHPGAKGHWRAAPHDGYAYLRKIRKANKHITNKPEFLFLTTVSKL